MGGDHTFGHTLSVVLMSLVAFVIYYVGPGTVSVVCTVDNPLVTVVLFVVPALSACLVPTLGP